MSTIDHKRQPASPGPAVTGVALVECACGLGLLALALTRTGSHSPSWLCWGELLLASLLTLTGLGLLRRRHWAATISTFVLYLGFFGALLTISLAFENFHNRWWYWFVPLLLPVLGWSIQALRRLPQTPR